MSNLHLDLDVARRLTDLDPSLSALTPALRACAQDDEWSLHDVRWTPGHGARLAYVDRSDDEPTFVAVEVSGEDWGRYAWSDDTELPALNVATDPEEVARRLEAALGQTVRVSIQPVRYRPGSRCVLRYDVETASGSSTLYAKALQSDSYARIAALHDALSPEDTAMLAEVVAWWPDLQMVVSRSVEGRSASSVLRDPDVSPDAKARLGHDLGHLLARFHELPVQPDATWTADQQLIKLADAMDAVECADPHMGIRLGAVLDTLAATIPAPDPTVVGHGSFRAGQVVVTPDGTPVLMDVDEVRFSDRERDLGIALAHLTWQEMRHPQVFPALARVENSILSSYAASAGEVRPSALRWWRVAGLVQVAVRRFRRLEVDDWPMTELLADTAEDLLAQHPTEYVTGIELLDPVAATGVLQRASGQTVEIESAELLADAPGRREVVRFGVRGLDHKPDVEHVIGKQFSQARPARLAYYHLRLLSNGPFGDGAFRVPRPLGLAGEHRLLFYREDLGQAVDTLLDGPRAADAIRDSASWLAKLHTSDLVLPRELSLVREVESTRQWAATIAQMHPSAAEKANVLASRWAAAAKTAAVDVVAPLHKDFHAGHVYVGTSTGVIDLDEARMGDPAFDVAHFCGYLDQLGAHPTLVKEFLDTYATATGWADKGTFAPFSAYTCLKIAKQAVTGAGPFREVPRPARTEAAEGALARGLAWATTPFSAFAGVGT